MTAIPGGFTGLGWYWSQLGTATLHLVPPRPGTHSRSPCGQVLRGDREEVVGMLYADVIRCRRCLDYNGGIISDT